MLHEDEVLTEEMLKSMGEGEVFATGLTIDNRTGINMSNSDHVLRWVAVRGNGYWDWAIYIQLASWTTDEVRRVGDKIGGTSNIRKLVKCDDEALKLYRR